MGNIILESILVSLYLWKLLFLNSITYYGLEVILHHLTYPRTINSCSILGIPGSQLPTYSDMSYSLNSSKGVI